MTKSDTITLYSSSVELDNGENLRDLAIGDSVTLRADTGHPGLWVALDFHGDFQDRITLQRGKQVADCSASPAITCPYNGTPHTHPLTPDGSLGARPSSIEQRSAAR